MKHLLINKSIFSTKRSFINKTAIIVHALFASLIIFQSITIINDATEISRNIPTILHEILAVFTIQIKSLLK